MKLLHIEDKECSEWNVLPTKPENIAVASVIALDVDQKDYIIASCFWKTTGSN